jgi:tetratricopeptide (TPR) repeat protein
MKHSPGQLLLSKSHFSLGNNLRDIGRLEAAEESYKKSILIKPDNTDAHNNLGTVLQELGRSEEAEESYKRAIDIKEDNSGAFNNLGSVLQELGRLKEAEKSYKQAIALNPDFAEAIFNLGIMFYQQNQFNKAAEQFTLIDFHMSKTYLLHCFYMEDRQSNFYDHLDYLTINDINNAVIGSLVSRSNIRYGINKDNPFCNKPLDYILQTNLLDKCDFKSIFIDAVKTILNDDKIQNRNQPLLTNGDLTAGNIFAQINPITDSIQETIRLEIEKYRTYFKDSKEGFITNWPKSYTLYGWLVNMKNGGKLDPHMHERGWLSGSIYINVPPKIKQDSGNLVVCIEGEKLITKKSHEKISVDVVTGSLCLFPASLLHYTIPFESDQERIVLAFDVIPK